ncbi:SYF2 splicing factor-domain-containing protein [Scheffersomyces coipomensis]|uniref:SYF2 splicing factor-domain-containing protein n=1 Tax=Scheffersomyces coipomensis TaxID=1788519 RepID=UPI00315C797F
MTTTNEALLDKLSRIRELKSKKNQALAQGKKDLVKNFRDQKLASSRQAELNSNNTENQESSSPKSSKDKDDSDSRKRVLQYTIEESELWDRKQKQLKKNQRKHGYQNMNTLAESSYNKEIKELVVDKDSYNSSKVDNDDKSNKKSVQLVNHKPSKEAVNQLVSNITQSTDRKSSKRNNKQDDDTSGYINDKNKQFNKKIDRQYGS